MLLRNEAGSLASPSRGINQGRVRHVHTTDRGIILDKYRWEREPEISLYKGIVRVMRSECRYAYRHVMVLLLQLATKLRFLLDQRAVHFNALYDI